MSVPVAGRRKGQVTTTANTAANATATNSAASPGVPSWLDDAAPGSATSAASPLTFADSCSPAVTSPQAFSSTTFSATSASPELDKNAGLPAFLLGEEAAQRQTTPPWASPIMQPTPSIMAQTFPPSTSALEEEERQRKRALADELKALTQQLADTTRHVEVLQGDSHAVAAEVRELETTLASLRAKEAEGQRRKEAHDSHVQQEAQEEAMSVAAHADVDAAAAAYRAELTQRCEEELNTLNIEVEAQKNKNASLLRECEEAMFATPEARCQTTAFEALQRRLEEGVRHLKQHFSQECSTTVGRSARVFLDSARQQRNEVFANDTARRIEQLHNHQIQRDKDMGEFYEECHRVFQRRTDSLFGALKTSMEKRRRQAEYEREQRLSAFHARLHAMTERWRATLEQQVRAQVEREVNITNVQRDNAVKELASRLNELAQQRRAFQMRAEREYQSLRETRMSGTTGNGNQRFQLPSFHQESSSTSAAVAATQSLAPSIESLRRELEEVAVRLNQMGLTFRTKQESLQMSLKSSSSLRSKHTLNFSSGQRTPLLPSPLSSNSSWLSFDAVVSKWRDAIVSLQQHRELLRKTIEEVSASTRSWPEVLQRGRRQLTEQQETVRTVRLDWEAKVRSQLSSCLTAQNSNLPPVASLTTSALVSLKTRLEALIAKQGVLRFTRGAFAAQMATWVDSVSEYRSSTEHLLSDIFSNFEVLREKSVQAEVDELTLRSVQAQVEVLHRHVTREAHRLVTQKQCLDNLIKDLQMSNKMVAPALPSSFASPNFLSHGHSKQIFNGSASPLYDFTNALHRNGVACEPPTLSPDQTNMPEKAELAALPLKEVLAVLKQTHPSTATSRSLTVLSESAVTDRHVSGGSNSNAAPGNAAAAARPLPLNNHVPTTAVSASSDADLFDSDSPSPIVSSLEGLSGWIQQKLRSSGTNAGEAFAGGTYMSASLQTDDTQGKVQEKSAKEMEEDHRRSVDTETDFTTDLEPLDDGDEDDHSEIVPLRSCR